MSTPSESMIDLIDQVVAVIDAGITAKEIDAVSVKEAISDDPSEVPVDKWPFIAVDDAGERIELSQSEATQQRVYVVRIQVNCYNMDHTKSLRSVLNRYNELKVVLEKNANRLMDDYNWAVAVTPFTWDNEEDGFFRGREILVEWWSAPEFRESQH